MKQLSHPNLHQFITLLKREQSVLAAKYKVKSLGLFGSYMRGEQRPRSDLDVLVEFSKTPTLLEFIRMENVLSDLLRVKVDLVMKKTLKPAIGRRILQEVVTI